MKLNRSQVKKLNDNVFDVILDQQIELECGEIGEAEWNEDMLDSMWNKVSELPVRNAWFVSYGPADGSLVMLVYDEYIEVGYGDSLRPYIKLTRTSDPDEAIEIFIKEAKTMIESMIPPTKEQLEAWEKELEEARDHFGDKK
jgi:hypothetical protein